MLHPRCEGCMHDVGECKVNVCASVRFVLWGKGLGHLLPEWRGQLVPEYKEVT